MELGWVDEYDSIKAVLLALGEVFFYAFAVVIDVASAVITDILVSPFMLELDIRIHF